MGFRWRMVCKSVLICGSAIHLVRHTLGSELVANLSTTYTSANALSTPIRVG